MPNEQPLSKEVTTARKIIKRFAFKVYLFDLDMSNLSNGHQPLWEGEEEDPTCPSYHEEGGGDQRFLTIPRDLRGTISDLLRVG